MNDLTLTELAALVAVFDRAEVSDQDQTEQELFARIKQAYIERQELEDMDFDDCLGGACKL